MPVESHDMEVKDELAMKFAFGSGSEKLLAMTNQLPRSHVATATAHGPPKGRHITQKKRRPLFMNMPLPVYGKGACAAGE